MKTVLEYSSKMPRGLRTRYLRNVAQQHGVDKIFTKYKTRYQAINETMTWSETPEGHGFWESIAHDGIKTTYKDDGYRQYFKNPKLRI